MQGPGLTVLEGYERGNRAQRDAEAHQMRQGATGLALVDKIQQMQRAAQMRNAFGEHAGDLEALEGELVRRGALAEAEKVNKIRTERQFQGALQSALRPDGTIDDTKLGALAATKGQFGPLMQAQAKRDALEEKRRIRGENQLAVGALAGTPGASFGGAAPGSVSPTSEQGRMLAEQFPEEPQANAAAITGGLQTVAPPRSGVLQPYLNDPDPAVRAMAQSAQGAIGALSDPKDAAAQLRSLDQHIMAHRDRVDTRNQRAEDKEADRQLHRDLAAARNSGDAKATALMQNIDFLKQRGIAATDEEAFRMLRTAMEKPGDDAAIALAKTLFQADPRRYRQGGFNAALQEAKQIVGQSRGPRQPAGAAPATGGALPPAPGAMPGSFGEMGGALSGSAPGASAPSQNPSGQFKSAEDVRSAFKAGKLSREQARQELKRFGFE